MANSINLDTAERLDITCRRGDSFALDLDVTDSSGDALDMTGYNFIMEVEPHAGLYSFDVPSDEGLCSQYVSENAGTLFANTHLKEKMKKIS